MGIRNKARDLAETAFRQAKGIFSGDAPKSAAGLLQGIFQAGEAPRRGTRELMQAYKRLPWLRAVSNRIASDVASVPFLLYRAEGKRGKRLKAVMHGTTGTIRRDFIRRAVDTGDLQTVDDHRVLDLLSFWNPALRSTQSRLITQVFVDLKGDGFWVKERAKDGKPVELWPVPPHWCAETPTASKPRFRFSYLGWQREIEERDVVWLRNPDPENPYGRGAGIAEALSDELDVDEYAAQHIKSWFYNRCMPDVFLSIEGIQTEEQAREYESKLRAKHQGNGRGHQVHVTNGTMTVQEVGQTFKDMQVSELRGRQRDMVVQVFGVPPEVLGILANSNRATIDAAMYHYSMGVLCPRMDFIVDALQEVVDEFEDGLILDYHSPVPEDREFALRAMQGQPWAFSQNEHRRLAGAPPLPKGDEVFPPMPGIFAPPAGPPALEPAKPAEEPAASDDEDEPAEAKALAGPVFKADGPEDVDRLLERLRPERLTKEVDPVWLEEMSIFGNEVLQTLDVDVGFDMRNPLIRSHMEEFSTKKIQGLVNETTRAQLRDSLIEGVYAGEGIADLKKRVEATFDDAVGSRAEVIARTEVVGSSNAANLSAYEQSGVVGGKEWITTPDSRTRDSHRALDGQHRGIQDPFKAPSGATAQAPGQFGIAGEDINCRCTIGPRRDAPGSKGLDVTGMSQEEREAVWRAYDARLGSWEKAGTAALQRGFSAQRKDLLDALDGR